MFTRGCLRRNMDVRIHLISLLCIGWIAYTNNSGLLLELTQFQSDDDVTLVCTDANTTIDIEFTFWYMDDVRVLTSVFAGNVCQKHHPNSPGDTHAYRYDLYTSSDVSVSCGDYQHNMTLTTTQYLHAGTVWRCEDQRKRVSNNLTLGLAGTTNNTGSQLTDSATTLAKLTTIKITTPSSNDNQDDTMYIAAGAGGGIMILIIIVICVGVVRRGRTRKVTQAISDVDNGAELSENPLYVTNQVELVDNKELLTNKTTVHLPAVVGAVNVDALYAVPDKSPKHLSAVRGAVNDGDMYAVPDKTPKHQSAVRGAVNVDDLYAIPDKAPKHQSAVRGAVNVDDLYAAPDKTPKHLSAVRGAVNDGDMYAVPDKTPKHQSAVRGALNVDDLYAVPDKTPEHQSAVRGAVNDSDMYVVPDKTPTHQSAVAGAVNVDDLYAVPDMSMKTKNGTYYSRSEADSEI